MRFLKISDRWINADHITDIEEKDGELRLYLAVAAEQKLAYARYLEVTGADAEDLTAWLNVHSTDLKA